MSKRKTERLLSLVLCLLATRRFLTAEQIRAAVPGYPPPGDAFKRMFERDKDELRELGIPLETGTTGDDETGYRISRQDYELPEITLETDEAAVLGLAARVWLRAELADAAAGALLKLRAAGVESDVLPGIEPRVHTDEAAFPMMWQAVRDHRPVTFGYQAAGRAAAQQRHLQPWGVVSRYGRWYVAGHDTDRGAPRVFRLSRVVGPVAFDGPAGSVAVPEGTDVRNLVRSFDGGQEPQRRAALLQVRRGTGYGLRRMAETAAAAGGAAPAEPAAVRPQTVPSDPRETAPPGPAAPGAGSTDPSSAAMPSAGPSGTPETAPAGVAPLGADPSGPAGQAAPAAVSPAAAQLTPGPAGEEATGAGAVWDRLRINFSDVDRMAGYLASFGPDVVVLDPPDLRDAVIGCLKAALT